MRVAERKLDGVMVVDVSGPITVLDNSGDLKDRVADLVKGGERQFVLNLGGLTFVDSSCIGELVSCCLSVARAGGSLKLANPARRVRELLLVTHLGPIFESYDTEAEAIASFGS